MIILFFIGVVGGVLSESFIFVKMKVLYFTKYSRNAGSSRLRSYQYFPFLENQGILVEVSPLFSEAYLRKLYAGESTKSEALKGYLKRFLKLFSVRKYDKVVIEKELFPYLPAFAECLFHFLGVKYFVDYDDAVFHNYDLSSNKLIRKFLSKKIDWVMKFSGCVVAGNDYLADRARDAGAKRIEIALFYIHPYFSKRASAATKLGELLASGIPVLTNGNVGDHEFYIREHDCGKILNFDALETYDFKDLFNQLRTLETSRRCRELAEKYFSLAKGVEGYKELYKEIFI